jgi:sensor histidine kinase regulating citrate/malate metabolism
MEKLKYTKGEWKLLRYKPQFQHAIGTDKITIAYTSIVIDDKLKEEALADAKLIAASPELLEALIEAKKELEYHNWQNTNTYNKIINAINKATK